jgi:hypothetical protein
VRLAGYAGVAQRFTLEAGEEAALELDLKKSGTEHATATVKRGKPAAAVAARPQPAVAAPAAPAPAAPKADGTLVVASSPWCNVTVDGQARGATPLKLSLKAGPHEVVLANPEFHIKRTLAVEVEPGQTVRKTLDFAPE